MNFSLSLLFVTSLAAATLLPLGSEWMLFAMLQDATHPVGVLLLVATVGNTVGSCLNWVLGRYLLRYQDRPWFYIKTHSLQLWQDRFARWGKFSLLGAWLPVVGDPLTFVAGVLKVPFLPFVMLVATGKALRYAVVVGLQAAV